MLINAVYRDIQKNSDGTEKCQFHQSPVVRWIRGVPHVIAGNRQIVPAEQIKNFYGFEVAEKQPVVGVMPGAGYRFVFSQDGEEFTRPVLCFVVRSDGRIDAMSEFGEDGYSDDATESGNFLRIDGPEEIEFAKSRE